MRTLKSICLISLSFVAVATGCGDWAMEAQPVGACGDAIGPLTRTGPPVLLIGQPGEDPFIPLQSNDELPISFGFQGGYWIMPTLRTTGLHIACTISADLIVETGERVGFLVDSEVCLVPSSQGTLDLESLPIPVGHLDDPLAPITDLYGLDATLELRIRDNTDTEITTFFDIHLTPDQR